jgi:Ser-tRNA(Ala) deacylase AlaX
LTQKLFWQDPYQTQLQTHITGLSGNDVTVAQTIFYAFSGGQESDAGTFNDQPVLQARKDGLDILYTLPDNHNFQPNDPVTIVIDWERRYRLMRLHFAAELILELTYRAFPGIEKIGAHIATDKSRIDFLCAESITPALPGLRQQALDLIQADHPITSAFSDQAAQRRYWEIDGFARVACGGTHLKRTGEVGYITLKRNNIGKGKERVEIYLAESLE